MATKWMARKRAQRAAPILKECQDCGATKKLQRHHPDYNKPDLFKVLCGPCHAKADQRDGHRRQKPKQKCTICKTMFLPKDSHSHKTCGKECLSEIGRRNAMKRWHGPQNQKASPVSPRA